MLGVISIQYLSLTGWRSHDLHHVKPSAKLACSWPEVRTFFTHGVTLTLPRPLLGNVPGFPSSLRIVSLHIYGCTNGGSSTCKHSVLIIKNAFSPIPEVGWLWPLSGRVWCERYAWGHFLIRKLVNRLTLRYMASCCIKFTWGLNLALTRVCSTLWYLRWI